MNADELRRLYAGPEPGERPRAGLRLAHRRVTCPGDAPTVLDRARAVLAVLLTHDRADWPSPAGWQAALPPWFVARCSATTPPPEARVARFFRWRSLSPEERLRAHFTRDWSVADWVSWFHPAEKAGMWAWWDAAVLDSATLLVTFEGQPYPWGLIEWLFRAAGASAISDEAGRRLWPDPE